MSPIVNENQHECQRQACGRDAYTVSHRSIPPNKRQKRLLLSKFPRSGAQPNRLQRRQILPEVTPLLATEKMREDNERQKRDKKRQGKELKLPPLPTKPQGPFKEPKAVYIQVRNPANAMPEIQ